MRKKTINDPKRRDLRITRRLSCSIFLGGRHGINFSDLARETLPAERGAGLGRFVNSLSSNSIFSVFDKDSRTFSTRSDDSRSTAEKPKTAKQN